MKRLLALGLALLSTQASAAQMDLGSQVAAGKQLFESTCSASTCHGSGGVGAGGPKLVDRNFALDFVRTTVSEGRVGTPMAAFKDLFDGDQMASVLAYVLSISTGGRWATAVPVTQSDKPTAGVPWPQSVAIGNDQGSPAAGYALFYDATRATACRTCHSYRDNGGPVGRDLNLLKTAAPEIFARLSKPVDSEAVTLTTAKGKVTGLIKSETGEVVKLVDVSSLPPVVRSVPKNAVTATEDAAAPFDHGGLSYTPQELRDAAAFLSVGK